MSYTVNTINGQVQKDIPTAPTTLPNLHGPTNKLNKILVVIDAQEDFVRGALRNADAMKALQTLHNLVWYAHTHFAHPIIYTMDSHDSLYLNSLEGKNLPIEHCIRFSDGWHLCPEAVPDDNWMRWIIGKHTFGALDLISGSPYAMHVDLQMSKEIWMCGFCTDICVSANFQILKAAFSETPIVIVEDACAGTTPEMHEAALKVMKSCQAKIATFEELIKEK